MSGNQKKTTLKSVQTANLEGGKEMLTDSEKKAYYWLISDKNIKEEDFRHITLKTPDFILKDGTEYEVKQKYFNSIYFYPTQIKNLKDDTHILIFDKKHDFPIHNVKWKEIKNKDTYKHINLRGHRGNNNVVVVNMTFPRELHNKIKLESINTHIDMKKIIIRKLWSQY